MNEGSAAPSHRPVPTPPGGAQPAPVPADRPAIDVTAELAALDEMPLAEHADAYQRMHTDLQAALADIDNA